MFSDPKFIWLIFISVLVGILEALALGGFYVPRIIVLPLVLVIIVAVGYRTLWHGLKAFFSLNFKSIQALMLIAVIGAMYLGKYEEAAIIIVLYTLAEKLEDFGIAKSQSALGALVEKMPATVTLVNGGTVPVEQVKEKDIILVKPSDMIPLDGKVVAGNSYVDESTITGEPIPKDKAIGDIVFAGTLNKQGVLEVLVTKTSKNTTFSKIKELTFHATQVKAKTQKFIETFSQFYTPAVLLLATLWVVIPVLFFNEPLNPWLLKGLALIVIACPCALVISTPISIYSAIGNASTRGALIKGGRYLEAIGQVKAIALDKTRTLTYGQPTVTDVLPLGANSKEDLLACAGGIEIFSEHPLARSIVEAAQNEKILLHKASNFQSILGKGAKADCLICEDRHHCIGKLAFVLEEHPIPAEFIHEIDRLQNEGKTTIVIATHKEIKGIIALSDKIRTESKQLIEGLNDLNIKVVMLTGDNSSAGHFVARELGIEDVKADLLPEDKAAIMEQLLNEYGKVGMVGDGVNDAPALALSNVGISISSLGSDTALEAASIIILNDRLDIILFLVKLGRKTVSTIKWNTILAIAVKLFFICLALLGMSQLALAIFADVGVTLIVILVSLRLLKWRE
jgi:Cd2+/Zn2+-exporting ATPase